MTLATLARRLGRWVLLLSPWWAPGCRARPDLVRSISAREAYDLVRTNRAVLVDVREEDEVRNGMAEPARWFATTRADDSSAWREFVATLPRDKDVILYCAKGGRSRKLAQKLAESGFRAASSGGYREWTDAGLPTRRPF